MSRTRSILLISNRVPYPLRDGGALAMDAMVRGYQAAGWQVHLLAMNTSRHPVSPEQLQSLYPDIAGFHTVEVDNSLRVTGLLKNWIFSSEPEHVSRFRNAAFGNKLDSLLRAHSFDIVQLESPFLGSYLPEIRRQAPAAKVVYRMHNVEGQIWGRLAATSTGLKARYLRSLASRMASYERELWAAVDLLLPITEPDAAAVRTAGITPMLTVPFGVNVPESSQPWGTGPLKLYHIGAMDWLPNREAVRWFLEEVWPGLHAEAPELSFHFAGRGMPESFRLDLPDGAHCYGEVADAADFVAGRQILVVPLRSGGGLRIKILEAMAGGKLVISTDIGMQGIEAEPGSHYLAANTAEDFVRQAVWAARHRESAEGIAIAARNFVTGRYNDRRIMSELSSHLETLLNE